MKFLSIILGVICLTAITTSVEARSHFSLSFNNAFVAPAPAPATYVVQPQPYYEPMYMAPQPYYEAPQPYYAAPQPYYAVPAREVVYVRPAPRPVVVRYARPEPVRQSSVGFSWNLFR